VQKRPIQVRLLFTVPGFVSARRSHQALYWRSQILEAPFRLPFREPLEVVGSRNQEDVEWSRLSARVGDSICGVYLHPAFRGIYKHDDGLYTAAADKCLLVCVWRQFVEGAAQAEAAGGHLHETRDE
jgi:hypothetical protein